MVDVPRVPGTGGTPDHIGGKDKSRVEGDKFKDLMKIEKTDPDLLKKRKRKEESEEEKKANLSGPISKERDAAHLDKIRPLPKIAKVGEAEKEQPQRHKRPEEAPAEISEEEGVLQIERERTSTFTTEEKKLEEKGERKTAAPLPPPMEEVIEEALTPIETPFIPEKEISPPSPKVEKKEEASPTLELPPPPPPAAGPAFLPAASTSPLSMLRAETYELFEKLVGVLSVMHSEGISETTIHLNSPEFANSIFAGAQIVIREFSTAPKAFNVEFQGNAQNTALFSASVADLMAAFQNGNYNFKINRIDTSLLSSGREGEKPMFHRKEKAGEKDMQGGQGETR